METHHFFAGRVEAILGGCAKSLENNANNLLADGMHAGTQAVNADNL